MTAGAADGILVVDNHDSFVHTLVGYLNELGAGTALIEADAIVDADAIVAGHAGVLISPGPGSPGTAGASIAVARAALTRRIPLLGVCLGHQVLAEACGAVVAEAPELMHGMTSEVHHDGTDLFAGLPSPFTATRYHSLAVVPDSLPPELAVTARTASGTVMGIAHRRAPAWGVQFHPEAVLTRGGYLLLGHWLERAGVVGAAARGATRHPHRDRADAGVSPRSR